VSNLWANKTAFWALAGVMVCALALRLWALNWGLPYLYDHDETVLVLRIQPIFKTGDLNPHVFDYGSLFYYINAAAYVPYYLVGWAAGIFHNPNDIPYPRPLAMGVGVTSMPSTYLLGRSVTLLFGMTSVYMVFLIGRRVTGTWVVGLAAAFMMAISPTCVAYSRAISPNMFLVFFILLTMWGAIEIYDENSTRAYALAGIAAGLVASTKYNGVMVLGVIVVACLLREGWRGLKDWRLLLAFVLSAITFFVTTPFALLDYQTFITDVRNQAIQYSTGHSGMEGDTVAWYASFLWTQEGLVTVLGFGGAIYALVRRIKPLILVASFPIGYGIFISAFIVRNDRTIMPMLPFLFILAAALIAQAVKWVTAVGLDRRAAFAGGVVVLALLAIGPVDATAAAAVRATAPDSRLTGVQWIKDNIPPGSTVGIEVGAPYLDPRVYSVQPVGEIILHAPDWYVQHKYDYLVFAQGMFGRFYDEPDRYANEVAQYDTFFNKFPLVKAFDDGGYAVKVYKVPKE
jgi:4-amino-4-deoxy-L-arabinose transferase-like glycosyltransferase